MERIIIDDTDQSSTPDPNVRSNTVLALPDEPIPDAVKAAYIADLEVRVRELVGSEPKDFARAAVLIYDIFRLRGEQENAREIARMFDLPAMVLVQVPPLVRSIQTMGPAPSAADRNAALERINDLRRLVIMALDGDADADVLRRLVDLHRALSATQEDPSRFERATVAADCLTNLVNAFFFDRLTAIPALRTYVVGLELGL